MADPTIPSTPNFPANVPNYLVQSILVTIFCCAPVPLGIVAIVFAAQVNGKLAAGDYAGAVKTSKQAKMWCWIAFGVGLLTELVCIVIYVLAVAAFVSAASHGVPPPHVR